MGRFINADVYVSTGQGFTGFNMFAYCGNNSVNRYDPKGTLCERTAGGGGTLTVVKEERMKEEFANAYYEATGEKYDFSYSGAVTVTKSTTTITKGQKTAESLVRSVCGLILEVDFSQGGRILITLGTLGGIAFDSFTDPGLGVGSYPTYTVTKRSREIHEVVVSNYYGIVKYEPRTFIRIEEETYIFLNGQIASINKSYRDEYLAYLYGR